MVVNNFRPVYYIWSKPTIVKTVLFITLVFDRYLGNPHIHIIKQRVNKTFEIKYAPCGVCNPIHRLPENVLIA